MLLVVFITLLVFVCGDSVAIQPGELYPEQLVGIDDDITNRCKLKINRDYKIAKANARLPMNAYELFSACDKTMKIDSTGDRGLVVFLMIHSCGGLSQILTAMHHSDIFIMVHLDLSASEEVSICVKNTIENHVNTQTHLLSNPFDTEWGSWEMVLAEYTAMQLTETMLKDVWSSEWSHFLVMSGSDFPLVPANELVDFFENISGKSFYYSNTMDDQTAAISLSQMTSVCDGQLYHLGWKSAAPPRSYFIFSNTWKFWSRQFVSYVLSPHGEELFEPLFEILSLTPSVDEVFWSTLHSNSPHCGHIADIKPRDYYYFLWPVDDPGRMCSPSIRHSPFKWYCPKRPYTWGSKDIPRMIGVPSLFVRKISSSKVRSEILSWFDNGRPRLLNYSGVSIQSSVGVGKIELSFQAVDPPPGDDSISQLLWWGWVPFGANSDEATGVPTPFSSKSYDITDCTGDVSVTSLGCLESNKHPAKYGSTLVQCRIRPKLFPSLCLSAKSSEAVVGMPLGFVNCSPYQEPQIFSFIDGLIRSAAKASLIHKDPLCLMPGTGSGLDSSTLQHCSLVKQHSTTCLLKKDFDANDEL